MTPEAAKQAREALKLYSDLESKVMEVEAFMMKTAEAFKRGELVFYWNDGYSAKTARAPRCVAAEVCEAVLKACLRKANDLKKEISNI